MCLESPYLYPHCFLYFSLVKREVVWWKREKGTGGWPQFDWMLNGGSFKAEPIEFRLFC